MLFTQSKVLLSRLESGISSFKKDQPPIPLYLLGSFYIIVHYISQN